MHLTSCNRCKGKKQADVQVLHVYHFYESNITVLALYMLTSLSRISLRIVGKPQTCSACSAKMS
jgi:hypothetical protein